MVKMSMRDKNIIDFFGIKVKCSFVNFFCVFTLVHSAFDKKFEVVTLHIKTGTCNCPCTAKKFEFQVKMAPLLLIFQFRKITIHFLCCQALFHKKVLELWQCPVSIASQISHIIPTRFLSIL